MSRRMEFGWPRHKAKAKQKKSRRARVVKALAAGRDPRSLR